MNDNPSPAAAARPRVLLVDDDPDLIDLYSVQLMSLGYEVASATSGREAVELLRSDIPFALLLTDVGLGGGMDGQATADEARKLRPALPIIFMSGYTPHFHNDGEGMEEGVTFLQKPFRKKQLEEAVAQVLGRPET